VGSNQAAYGVKMNVVVLMLDGIDAWLSKKIIESFEKDAAKAERQATEYRAIAERMKEEAPVTIRTRWAKRKGKDK